MVCVCVLIFIGGKLGNWCVKSWCCKEDEMKFWKYCNLDWMWYLEFDRLLVFVVNCYVWIYYILIYVRFWLRINFYEKSRVIL